MGTVIDIANVSWKRQDKKVLHNINWEVKHGEHWAVLGLNGSGKTSLLNMVNGYIWPSSGEVSVLGNKFGETDLQELRKTIGWISFSLGEKMNGRQSAEDIVISGKFASVGIGLDLDQPNEFDFEKAMGLMTLLDVEYTYGQPYEKCSQGEKQKLLIARALMADSKLLILDEPTNGLDFIAREELLNTIEHIAKQENAPTIILVTHHMEEILPIFSHTLILKDGTTFAKGEREEILTSKNMTALYKRNIQIDWRSNRAWMKLV